MRAPDVIAGSDLVEVTPAVYAWVQHDGSWWVNNAGAIIGDDGVILVDTCATAQRTRAFLSAVDRAAGGAPVRVAVNTHLHGDHTHGNALLPESTVIVGHQCTREGILADTVLTAPPAVWDPMPRWGIDRHRAPTVIPDGELTLYTGQRQVRVCHPGFPTHTTGDVVGWLPQEGVLFAGDLLFHGVTPLVFMGSVDGALRSLDWIAGFSAAHIIPGHGPIITGEEIELALAAHGRYYRLIQETARLGRENNQTPLQAAQSCELGEFANWSDPERLVLNLHRAYCDMTGTDIDLMAAFTDAIAFNHGPLRCIA
jgi:cyclase